MRRLPIIALTLGLAATAPTLAQTTPNPADFHGAEATKARYRAAYQLNTDDSTHIISTLKNIQNALSDPRLKGKLDIELVVHGSGLAVYRRTNPYEKQLASLQKQGVILAMCENTMRAYKVGREELFPFVSYVPSGNGELIIRAQEGWAVIHP
ncbi:DsrE family protein [Spirosoma luteolum]